MPRPAGRQLALVAAGFWSPMDEMLRSRHQARITSFLFACSHTPTDACCWGGYHLFSRRSPPSFSPGAGRGMLASGSIGVGDIALEIPESLSYHSNFLISLKWTCFEALPANFNTSWALGVPSTGWNQHWQLHLRVSHDPLAHGQLPDVLLLLLGANGFVNGASTWRSTIVIRSETKAASTISNDRYNISLLQKIGLDEAEVCVDIGFFID
ncbi:hypothetical protein EJB05_16919, partial [Eragrostis curvula]